MLKQFMFGFFIFLKIYCFSRIKRINHKNMNIFKKVSVKTINAISIFSIVLVFLIVGFVSYKSMLQIDVDEIWVIHSYQVSTNINVLMSDLENIETSFRGYVITGQDIYLEPYNMYLPDIDKTFTILDNLTINNSIQHKSLSDIRPLIDEKIANVKEGISLRKNIGLKSHNLLLGHGLYKSQEILVYLPL